MENEWSDLQRKFQSLFQEFNLKYFDGRLPHYHVKVVSDITRAGEQGQINRKRRLIRLTPGDCMEATLVHEMAHAASNVHHAAKWQGEMKRLLVAGAPVCEVDLPIGPPVRITKGIFRKEVEGALHSEDCAQIDFRLFIREFLRSVGGAPSIAAFERTYPWARAEFAATKKSALGQLRRSRPSF